MCINTILSEIQFNYEQKNIWYLNLFFFICWNKS